ncbi:glycoside hydrolase/deacetylase [Parathielavia hyrcaniae]|uniref:Glycoside hydrolase/deacetylase n=1 Tax=Parathielavia hyrcaniae TaxID=113614 RepID=A0AAN6T022_9PEZI|nr:glycoside hydrolase/deacetylase [Parathielavia hyrcaniae]
MPSPSPASPWPSPYKAAIAFTMDNLGEAQDVRRGAWPHPVGTHPSVTSQLPRMLALLASHRLRATFFAEAWSLEVYPSAVRALLEGGHEVAWHGFQHEVWSGFRSEEGERECFEKSWEVMNRGIGVEYAGFRPPGGEVNEWTWGLLKEFGVRYVSPLGEFGLRPEGVVVLPFEWKAVDAFWYMEKFAGIREQYGEGEQVMSPRDFREWLMGRVDETAKTGGFLSILFHPFLQTSEDRFEVLEEVLKRISRDQDIWVAPCKEIAEWESAHPERFQAQARGQPEVTKFSFLG